MQKFIQKFNFLFLLIVLTTLHGFSQSDKDAIHSTPIVLIHGLFQNSYSWTNWKSFFEERGFTVYTPSYPYHEGNPTFLQQNVDPGLITLDFNQVLIHLTDLIDTLPIKPIIIGHSMGGLLMQKMVESEKAYVGIGLAPANPRGISTSEWRYIRSNFRMVNPLRSRNKVCRPPLRWFNYTFFNTIGDSMASVEHNTFFVPESRIIAKSSTEKSQKINFSKPHAPMLFISGEKDNDLPTNLIHNNYKAYTDPNSIREFYQFPSKSHYIASEPGWEQVADYVYQWILRVAESPSTQK